MGAVIEMKDAPLQTLDPGRVDRFADGTVHKVMTRLRREAPIHYCPKSEYGPYWSIARYADIMEIGLNPRLYSSRMGVSMNDGVQGERATAFTMMDPPDHTPRRRALMPAFSPSEMKRLSGGVFQRTAELIDSLPRGEAFDWVQHVSIRLTIDMLATLFDFPWDDRDKLIEWTEWSASPEKMRDAPEERAQKMAEMVAYFGRLWQERKISGPAPDLVSRMIHSPALSSMDQAEFYGTLGSLIVGGNDTTRNTMSSLIIAFDKWPDEWTKVMDKPQLIRNAGLEALRWHTPATHMRRTLTADTEFRGHRFREGDKVILWYISANRDEDVFEQGERFIADRHNARMHLSFGSGVHRCIGARIAELQLDALLSEMARREMRIAVDGPIIRKPHYQLPDIQSLPVRIVAG